MSLSQDYESSSSSEEDNESPVNELPRPIYIRKQHHHVKKPDVVKRNNKPVTKLSKPSRVLVYERVATNEQQRTLRNPITHSHFDLAEKEHLVEYGPPINGYKFITTPEDIRLLATPPQQPAEQQESPYLHKYWNSAAELKLLPVDPGDQINKNNVYSFYQKSCVFLKQDMKKIIKGERIRWHPDRMNLPEATQIFQIINSLWESLQQEI